MGLSEREVVAWHEAGHAVVGVVLDLPVAVVTIVPNESAGYAGQVALDPPGLAHDLDGYVRRAVMLWAGQLVDHMARAGGIEGGSDSDDDSILACGELASLGPGEIGGFLSWTRARTMSVLSAHMNAVCDVAAALLEHRTLSGDEVRRIVAEASTTTQHAAGQLTGSWSLASAATALPRRSRRPLRQGDIDEGAQS